MWACKRILVEELSCFQEKDQSQSTAVEIFLPVFDTPLTNIEMTFMDGRHLIPFFFKLVYMLN